MAQEQNVIIIDGKTTIDSALQLIRYDIPCLILGKSSIGKSYTLIKITERWHIPNQLLYVGSEKAENIEGIPKLTDRGQTKEGKDKEIMEYLQPFWFPNPDTITKSVMNGRAVFERFVKSAWDVDTLKKFTPNYMNLHSLLNGLENLEFTITDLNQSSKMYEMDATLKDENFLVSSPTGMVKKPRVLNPKKLFTLKKDATPVEANDGAYYRNDLADFCAYVRTVLGYGNYWLILDEIDKVLDHDQDKFAPLLHIVRERTLKNFTMIDINEGKGLGIPLGDSFKEGGYANMIADVNRLLDSGESVLDTRVMAIANKTKNIETALFRRFCQLIADDILIWREQDQTTDETRIAQCLTKIKDEMVEAGEEGGTLLIDDDLVQYIDEVNLQWEYNFLPKMLNKYDLQGNYFRENAMVNYEKTEDMGWDWLDIRQTTAFFNLLENNFYAEKYKIPNNLYDCLQPDLLDLATEASIGRKSKEEEVKGIAGIFDEKIKEFGGDLSLAARDIANSVQEKYPYKVQKSTDKLNLLVLWTEKVLEYMEACVYANPTKVAPLDIAKYLIPQLTKVFFGALGADKETLADNAASLIQKWQDWWQGVLSVDSTFEYDCDKDTTQEVFYGGTQADLDSLSETDLKNLQPQTLVGSNAKLWADSASGTLTKSQMEDGLQVTIPMLSKALGVDGAAEIFAENFGTIDYLNQNFSTELNDIKNNFEAKVKSFAGNPQKKTSRQNYFNAVQLINSILGEE
jgi:hypothetical protein